MFASRYYPSRYFAPRYFPVNGATGGFTLVADFQALVLAAQEIFFKIFLSAGEQTLSLTGQTLTARITLNCGSGSLSLSGGTIPSSEVFVLSWPSLWWWISNKLWARNPTGIPAWRDASLNTIPTDSWVELVASTSKACTMVHVNNGTTSLLRLGLGAEGSEQDSGTYVPASRSMMIPLNLRRGTRVSLRALDTPGSVGKVTINFFG